MDSVQTFLSFNNSVFAAPPFNLKKQYGNICDRHHNEIIDRFFLETIL